MVKPKGNQKSANKLLLKAIFKSRQTQRDFSTTYAAVRGIEPRGGGHAEADTELRGSSPRRTGRHPRPHFSYGNVVGARTACEPLGISGALLADANLEVDETYKADVKRDTLNIADKEKRQVVLEAFNQLEDERKYGRFLPLLPHTHHGHETITSDVSG